MKKGFKITILLLLLSLSVFSQVNRYGTPLISRFDASATPGELRNLCITMDKSGVMYFGNESGGIVTYNGSRWGKINTPGIGAVTTLITDTHGIVYAGGSRGFGFLQPDNTGRMVYVSLAGLTGSGEEIYSPITSSTADSNYVYFSDGRRLFVKDPKKDSVSVIDLKRELGIKDVSALLAFDNRLIIADNQKGLFARSADRTGRIPGGEKVAPAGFIRLLPYDRDNLLIGDAQNGLMLFNIRTGAIAFLPADTKSKSVVQRGSLTDVALLPGNLIAAGYSDRGGVYIYSHEGTLLQHISERTAAVTESSVTAMYCNNTSNSQLWFCTSGFINRASISLPASGFTPAAGITSVCGPVAEYAGEIFAGTENGLLVSYTDPSGERRFRRKGGQGARVYSLAPVDLPEGRVLLAATENGLLQLDSYDDLERFLPGLHLTAARNSGMNPGIMISGSPDGTVRTLVHDGYEWEIRHTISNAVTGRISDIEQTTPGDWWLLTSDPVSLVRMRCESNDTSFVVYGRYKGVISDTLNSLAVINNNLYLCTGRGISVYDGQDDTFRKDHDLTGKTFDEANIRILISAPEGEVIISGYDARNFDAIVATTRQGHVVFRRQFDFLPDLATTGISYADGSVWLAKGQNLFVMDKSKLAFRYGDFSTLFTRISTGSGHILMDGTFYTDSKEGQRIPSAIQPARPGITISHRDNNLTFNWTTTSYIDEEKTEYRHRLEGYDDDWSSWEKRTCRDYTNLPSGDYRFVVKARTITGFEGEEISYSFSVKRPWLSSLVAKLFYIVIAGWLLFLLMRYSARRLRIRNKRLDNLLRQRNEAAAKGRNEIEGLEKYAGLVQQTLLHSERRLGEAIPNSFLLNRPKGAVSGDFFWISRQGERSIIAAGDCTGHGVPSALRTVMALCFLDEIADRPGYMSTSEMLREFRNRLIRAFSTLPADELQSEGIDISLLSIDTERKTVEYSGAAMQCFRVREMSDQERIKWYNGEFKPNAGTQVSGKYLLETVYGDRMPLGMHLDGDHLFTQHTWKLEKNSSYYLFTDGYPDQFNGATGKKFMRRNMRKLILDIQNFPMSKQKEILEERLGSWMGNAQQTDDILVAGLRIDGSSTWSDQD